MGSSGSSPSTVRSPGIVIVPIWSAIVAATIQLRMRLVTGLEVMRRTIGAARVGAVESDEASLRAIDLAERWISDPPSRPTETGG